LPAAHGRQARQTNRMAVQITEPYVILFMLSNLFAAF
jgi:hypothetical protein